MRELKVRLFILWIVLTRRNIMCIAFKKKTNKGKFACTTDHKMEDNISVLINTAKFLYEKNLKAERSEAY